MKSLEKLDKILKPFMANKDTSLMATISASTKSALILETMLLEEYEKGYQIGKEELKKSIINKQIKEN